MLACAHCICIWVQHRAAARRMLRPRLSPGLLKAADTQLLVHKAAISVSRTFLKAILEPERVYFYTSLDKRRREEDAEKNQKRKL